MHLAMVYYIILERSLPAQGMHAMDAVISQRLQRHLRKRNLNEAMRFVVFITCPVVNEGHRNVGTAVPGAKPVALPKSA